VAFINNSQQLLTTASDGLLKLWNVRGEECVATMDNHEDKVSRATQPKISPSINET
jgi:U3 small nucleolar RNA-associated protein 13